MTTSAPGRAHPRDEQRRRVADARFEKLFETAEALSIQGYLPDGTLVYWNHASERIYGYTAEEALGRNLLDLIIPDEMRRQVEAAVRRMFKSGRGIPAGRLTLKHKNGRPVPVHSSHTVVSIPGEVPILFCMDIDMTALAQAEDELRIAATAFETQLGMAILDPDCTVLRVNRAFTQTTGYSADDIVGRPLALIHSDVHTEGFYSANRETLKVKGFWEDEVWHRRKNGEVYPDWMSVNAVRDQHGAITQYVCSLTDLTRHKQAEARISELSFFDPLTKLPNRRLFLNRLERAVTRHRLEHGYGALLLIDLDRFQALNDTLGHAFGDQLLEQTARRLETKTRPSDTLAHLAADEFVLMLEGLGTDPDVAARRAEAIGRDIIAEAGLPYVLGDHTYEGSVSIGVCLFPAGDGGVDTLMKQADLALHEAKSAGRNALRFFDALMQASLDRRAELIRCLRAGSIDNEFSLYYQPQCLVSGRVFGAEALLRWQRPGHGLVAPGQFIDVAEESDLIWPIGAWVLETACRQLIEWANDPVLAGLTLAVNVSGRQFMRPDFVALVERVLSQTGANPSRLELELTESMLIKDIDDVVAKMLALKSLGIRFSLDDFGTGYSSLAYLQRLPLDRIKIDQSFIREIPNHHGSEMIVRTIVALGRSLGISVLAEGVETESQRELLARIGCDAYQGYLLGRPVPAEELAVSLMQARQCGRRTQSDGDVPGTDPGMSESVPTVAAGQ